MKKLTLTAMNMANLFLRNLHGPLMSRRDIMELCLERIRLKRGMSWIARVRGMTRRQEACQFVELGSIAREALVSLQELRSL